MKLKNKIVSIIIIFLCLLGFVSPIFASTPIKEEYANYSVYILDVKTKNEVVKNGEAEQRVYPASITKLLTTLTLIDVIGDLDSKVVVGDELDLTPFDSSTADLVKGETLTYNDLIYALLLPSGNDTAIVLAVNAGRVIKDNQNLNYLEAIEAFVGKMNEKAKELGMDNSSFRNPHGFHDENHYSTPSDLIKLGLAAYNNELIKKVVATKEYKVTTNLTEHEWINVISSLHKVNPETKETNPYYNANIVGLKTGYTEAAGNCLLFYAIDGEKEIIGVVLKAPERKLCYSATNLYLDYALKENEAFTLFQRKDEISTINIENTFFKKKNFVNGYIKQDVNVYMEKDEGGKVNQTFNPNLKIFQVGENNTYTLKENISANTYLGDISLDIDGKNLGTYKIYSSNKVVIKGLKNLILGNSILFVSIICILIIIIATIKLFQNKRARIYKKKGSNSYKLVIKSKRKKKKKRKSWQ